MYEYISNLLSEDQDCSSSLCVQARNPSLASLSNLTGAVLEHRYELPGGLNQKDPQTWLLRGQ